MDTATKERVINGRVYSMWNQFVDKQEQWIGGILEDHGDSIDRRFGFGPTQTEITAIVLRENGKESAWFEVNGKAFSCGFDVHHGGVVGGDEGWITFSGYGGHSWRIKVKEVKV